MQHETEPVMPVRLSVEEKESDEFVESGICRSVDDCILPEENKGNTSI